MKIFQLAVFILILSPLVLRAQESVLSWQAASIEIDGKIGDWHGNLKNYDKSIRTRYEFRNDSTNLYLAFEILDQNTQVKTITSGIQIRVFMKRKPKINATIQLPILTNQLMKMGHTFKPNFSDLKDAYQLGNYPIDLAGFKFSNGIIYPKGKEDRISFACQWNEANILVYEICIPLKEIFGAAYDFGSLSRSKISIETKLLAKKHPSKHEGMQQSGGTGSGRGGMSGAGGRSGGMGRGMGGGQSRGMGASGERRGQGQSMMLQEQSFIKKFKLSQFKRQ